MAIIIKKRAAVADEEREQDYSAQQVSGRDERGRYVLSVLVKKIYDFTDDGKCHPSGVMLPLVDKVTFYEKSLDLIDQDYELFPIKLYTDVVLKGTAYHPRPTTHFPVEIQINNISTTLLAIGHRKAYLNLHGKIAFSDPEPIDRIPLRYDYAYGGRDVIAEEKIPLPPEEVLKQLPPDLDLLSGSPYRYQRNPVGKGYLVENNKRAFEHLELPNLEDVEDRLTPDRLLVGDPQRWLAMPLPRCTDWFNPTWFPRSAYTGLFTAPEYIPEKILEIVRKWADPGVLENKSIAEMWRFRIMNGASLGLQIPHITGGGVVCRLTNLHPRISNFTLQLPKEVPKIWVDGRKQGLIETSPVMHNLVIEPEINRVSIIWRGSAVALRPYLEHELKTMPYKVTWN